MTIIGVIERGDADKLAEALSSPPSENGIFSAHLASSGGDVLEAMKMGRMLRESFIPTRHSAMAMNGRCAGIFDLEEPELLDADSCGCHSSCFVIWAGGPMRTASPAFVDGGIDTIGIHRPKYDADYFSGLSASEAEVEYDRITDLVMLYLSEMGIPDELVEKMLSISSEDIYLLDRSEIKALEAPPAIEEWFISKCGEISDGDQSDYDSYLMLYFKGKEDGKEYLSESERRHYVLLQKQEGEYARCKHNAIIAEQQLRR